MFHITLVWSALSGRYPLFDERLSTREDLYPETHVAEDLTLVCCI